MILECLGCSNALCSAAAVSQDDERRFSKDPKPVHPAPKQNLAWSGYGNILNERAVSRVGSHANPARQRLLEPQSGGAIQLPASRRRSIQAVSSLSRFSLLGPARSSFRFRKTSQRGLSSSPSYSMFSFCECKIKASTSTTLLFHGAQNAACAGRLWFIANLIERAAGRRHLPRALCLHIHGRSLPSEC
jgi:hypothetical protein